MISVFAGWKERQFNHSVHMNTIYSYLWSILRSYTCILPNLTGSTQLIHIGSKLSGFRLEKRSPTFIYLRGRCFYVVYIFDKSLKNP
ncbi:hypothetical protein SBF1_5540002 [Candidatus Desulfosporosinus infrequens]|uniref:Uncharacterized protein n=1 Tax=Candidatus Desulfosporosinus infrequens TaxID=2043169 RepID=A0A2U3LJN2_9FIRM|nr:hypothetical protein SBF1_5540002 [Candidatus Desulfosporosinus infrequens]